MGFETYLKKYKAFIFELDDVLYPQRDYLLQVYYLFAQFMEYTEQYSASAMLDFMKECCQENGPDQLFEKTAARFDIPDKYRTNFDLLHQNARLPLKLLLYDVLLKFLQEIVLERKQIILFTQGDPLQQLNKIRQTEWNGLESYLTVYFAEEIGRKPSYAGTDFIAEKHALNKDDLLMIGNTHLDQQCAENSKINFLQVDKLLLP